jgi:CHAT domain-containing protein
MSKVEQEGLCTLLRGRVRALSPAECSKATVLTELQGNYDAIHFCCHASYDDSNPIGAALHLVRDPRNDRQRITAYELLS